MQTSVLLMSLAACVAAFDPKGHEWRAPGANDRRSPCPMVNTMANHGYIPRSGFNVSISELLAGFKEGVNLDPAATQLVAALALRTSSTGHPDTVHLSDLVMHNVIEHDASLSRQDLFLGDNLHFNPAIWAQTSSHFTEDIIPFQAAVDARADRIATAAAVNPDFALSADHARFSALETASYLIVFGDVNGENARRDWVNYFFTKERLPFRLGFSKSEETITADQLLGLTGKVVAASS